MHAKVKSMIINLKFYNPLPQEGGGLVHGEEARLLVLFPS